MPKPSEPAPLTAPRLRLIDDGAPLIAANEKPAVEVEGDAGTAGILLICEHAGNCIPRSLGGLGLDEDTRRSHAAWDPGALQVAKRMSERLAAPLVWQRYSRLVYDCNRPPEAESAMPAKSEIYGIPGNARLTDAGRQARIDAIYRPFHDHVAALLNRFKESGRRPAIVTVHSFTPIFHGRRREVELGFLHDADARLADAMLAGSEHWSELVIRRNQPYGPDDGVTHTLRRHGIARGLPNVMIEIRNDLIDTPERQSAMADRLSTLMQDALDRLPAIDDAGRRPAANS